MSFHFKARLIGFIWFGIAAFFAALLVLGKIVFEKQLLFYLMPWIVCVGSLMGFFYGYRVLLPPKKKGFGYALKVGFWGGLLSLIILDLGVLIFISGLMYVACHNMSTCQKDFQGAFLFDLKFIATTLVYEGWAAILVGMIAASVLYLVTRRTK